MYVIQNAIKNVGRNKGRNILMAVIIFAIMLTTAVSIIINTTTGTIIEDYKSRFGSEVNITFDTNQTIPMSEYKPLSEISIQLKAEAVLKIMVISLILAGASSLVGIMIFE